MLFPNTLWPLLIGHRPLVLRRGGWGIRDSVSMRGHESVFEDRLFGEEQNVYFLTLIPFRVYRKQMIN